MLKHFLLLFIVLSLCNAGCKSSKPTAQSPDVSPPDSTWIVKYERTPCFGDCPIYTFFLTSDHHGLIESSHNFFEPGWYYADLDEESVHALLAVLDPEEWWNEDLSSQPEITDLPGRNIVYKHKNGLRWFAIGGRTSDHAEFICGTFDQLIADAAWEPTTIRPLNPDVAQPSDVIVQLKDGVEIERWMQKFKNFGIRLVKKVAPNLPYYVVTWDLNKGTANNFLKYIKDDRDVVDAQWDQAINGRSKKSETFR